MQVANKIQNFTTEEELVLWTTALTSANSHIINDNDCHGVSEDHILYDWFVANCFEKIKSVMDIKNHAKEFDSNGDGKADMVACPPGWGCEKQITKHFAELGLGDFINPVQADYSASMADAIAKYKNGKSVLFYTWTPNWTVGALELGKDIVWIEVPYSETKAVKVPNATKSKINMGFGADDIRPAANVAFLKANPKVEKMLKKASIPLADVAAQNMKMNQGEKSEKAIKKHASAWIKANQSTFDSWLK